VDLLPVEGELRRELLCELGIASRMRGELERAEQLFAEAADASAAQDDKRLELRARLELAHVRSKHDHDAIGELLARAYEAIPVFETFGDDRGLGRAWLLVGVVRGGVYCENAAWEEAAAKAAEHYRRSGWSPSTCLNEYAGALYYGPRPVGDAIELCEQLLRDHPDDRASEANVVLWMGGLEAMRARFDEARSLVDRASRIYEELGQTLGTGVYCRMLLGSIEMLAGRPAIAEDALRRSCEVASELHEFSILASRAAELADALYRQGRYEEAEDWARTSREHAADDDLDAQSSWRSVTAKLEAQRGDFAEAKLHAHEAVQLIEKTDAVSHHASILADRAEVLRAADEEEVAREDLRKALVLFELKGNTVAAGRARSLLGDSLVV
jgi:tetratricopeptide (TPR) repeat protein